MEHEPAQRGLRESAGPNADKVPLEGDILGYLQRKLVGEGELLGEADIVFLENLAVDDTTDQGMAVTMQVAAGEQVPFEYVGGYVGYLGYEVHHDTQRRILAQEGGSGGSSSNHNATLDNRASPNRSTNPNVPTATFLFADRSLVYDHHTGDWYMVGVTNNTNASGDSRIDAQEETCIQDTLAWMHRIKSRIRSMEADRTEDNRADLHSTASSEAHDEVAFVPNRSKSQYQKDIARSHEEIRNGESYELCVTNQLEAEITLPRHSTKAHHESPFELYKLLREKNPAPFSAFMNFYGEDDDSRSRGDAPALSICCSSPERFLSVKPMPPITDATHGSGRRGPSSRRHQPLVVESKPIKGTAARYVGAGTEPEEAAKHADARIAAGLRESIKDRAENLMIVDLLRNDLGRVCRVGSVHVPKLMHIESYATVHQMVSTVRGILDAGDRGTNKNAIDVLECCFPGGSMTGAPKQRTVEILEEIEEGVSRGPYSGCLGYISLNGCMDMNIVIRSAVLTPSRTSSGSGDEGEPSGSETWNVSIGCGGAITALSESDDEYREMLLKSRVVRSTVSGWAAHARRERARYFRRPDESSP